MSYYYIFYVLVLALVTAIPAFSQYVPEDPFCLVDQDATVCLHRFIDDADLVVEATVIKGFRTEDGNIYEVLKIEKIFKGDTTLRKLDIELDTESCRSVLRRYFPSESQSISSLIIYPARDSTTGIFIFKFIDDKYQKFLATTSIMYNDKFSIQNNKFVYDSNVKLKNRLHFESTEEVYALILQNGSTSMCDVTGREFLKEKKRL